MVVSRFEEALDKWIENNPDASTGRKEPFELNGKRRDLEVYRLPTELLRYNIRNGRFAAELRELESQLQRHLDPEVEADAAQIQGLLLHDEKQAKYLEDDILRVGQLRPGVITRDGAIIDGNRRVAVLKKLHDRTPEDKFQFFESVRLPLEVSPKDIWKIEAGIQLSTDLKASYGPINELLKIREGIDAGLSEREVGLILGGDNTEEKVREKLQRLKLIEAYLEFIRQPFVYSTAERRHEHFIDLQHIMAGSGYQRLDTTAKENFITMAFEFIRAGIAHLQVRRLLNISRDSKETGAIITKTLQEVEKRQPRVDGQKMGSTSSSSKDSPLIDELLKTEKKISSSQSGSFGSRQETEDDENPAEGSDADAETKDESSLKVKYNDFIADAFDAVEARKRQAQPTKSLNKATRAIELLKEVEPERLRPLRRGLQKLKKDVEWLITRAKD